MIILVLYNHQSIFNQSQSKKDKAYIQTDAMPTNQPTNQTRKPKPKKKQGYVKQRHAHVE